MQKKLIIILILCDNECQNESLFFIFELYFLMLCFNTNNLLVYYFANVINVLEIPLARAKHTVVSKMTSLPEQ